MAKQTYINCTITRGAFSQERVFELKTYSGNPHAGIAPLPYCRKPDLTRLSQDEPAIKTSLRGLVEATLISNGTDMARVSIPDGATIEVKAEIVVYG